MKHAHYPAKHDGNPGNPPNRNSALLTLELVTYRDGIKYDKLIDFMEKERDILNMLQETASDEQKFMNMDWGK